MPASDVEELVALGTVTRPQGVRGQVRVKLHNPDSRVLLSQSEAFFTRDAHTRLVKFRELPRAHQGDVVLWPLESGDRDHAETLRGHEISVPRSTLPKLPVGEYYHRDLIGLSVREPDGTVLGEILRVDTYPTIDVAVVTCAAGLLEIPIMDPYWVNADIDAGCVVVDHIEHLRSLTSSKD